METNKILAADILDIIFDGKNKWYGAYQLRKTYNRRLLKATLITTGIALVAILGAFFSSKAGGNSSDIPEVMDTRLVNIKDPAIPVPPPPPPPPRQLPVQQPRQQRFLVPVVVSTPVEKPETIQDLPDNVQIGSTNVDGEAPALIEPPVVEKGSTVFVDPKQGANDGPALRVDMEAQFPGGLQAWKRYLEKNLDAETPVNNAAPAGTYRVLVKFIVSVDGGISSVEAQTKYGFGMEAEAIKIIEKGPKWSPAMNNGRPVKAYRVQPITFVVAE